ncbi:trigger factor [Magnetococcales bacterium HHB-1]
MEVTVEENGTFDRIVEITIPADRVTKMLDQELKRLAGNVRMPGFRPGKVPARLIEKRYRDHLNSDIGEKLVRETFADALATEKLRPVATPEITQPGTVRRGKPYSYRAALQIFPTIAPQGYRDLTLTRKTAEVKQDDVDRVLLKVRESFAEYENREAYGAENGDRILMDFAGTVDGEAFEGGTAEDHLLDLGAGKFIPGFEEQLVGIQANEEKDVQVTFPEDYHEDKLAGKDAVFKCKIKEVRQRKLPPVDDALAEKQGIEEGGADAMIERIWSALKDTSEEESKRQIKQQILQGLLDANKMELPSQLVDLELADLIKGQKDEFRSHGYDPDKLEISDDVWRERLGDKAHERVILGLLMGSITKEEEIAVEDSDVDDYINMLEQKSGNASSEVREWLKSDPGRMDNIKATVLEQKVIDWLIENNAVSEEEVSFQELVKDSEAG